MLKHYHIEIRGKVNRQGYKLQTMILANRYTIQGKVSEGNNLIEIEAEGEEAKLDTFVAACKKEMNGDRIDEMTIEKRPLAYYDEFIIH
nr:acylphosphatase [Bacteroidota bacterium]